MNSRTLLAFFCGAAAICLIAAGPEILATAWKAKVDQRLDKLEAYVQILRRPKPAGNPRQAPPPDTQPPRARRPTEKNVPVTSRTIITVVLMNKRFDDGKYEDHIWWDSAYTSNLSKSTRAVKGNLEFADLFGEVGFTLKVVINDALRPGRQVFVSGTGFEYNQFLDPHDWMRATPFKDMKITLKVKSIIYADGTTEQFTD